MLKTILSLLTLAGFLMLAGCNTVQGLGQDIKSGGEAVSDGAEKVKKKL